MVVAPVNLIALKGLGYSFQHLEFLSFQGMSAAMTNTGTYCLCNGANLAYLKKCFYEVGGFKGINENTLWRRYVVDGKIFSNVP